LALHVACALPLLTSALPSGATIVAAILVVTSAGVIFAAASPVVDSRAGSPEDSVAGSLAAAFLAVDFPVADSPVEAIRAEALTLAK